MVEIQVLHAQLQSLHQTQAGAVEQPREDRSLAVQMREDGRHLLAGENDRQANPSNRPTDVVQPGQVQIQHSAIEKDEGRKSLAMRGRCSVSIRGQVHEELLHMFRAKVARVAQSVELHEVARPVDVRVLRALAEVQIANAFADLVEESAGFEWGQRRGGSLGALGATMCAGGGGVGGPAHGAHAA